MLPWFVLTIFFLIRVSIRVFNRNSVALRDAERNAIVPAISARFVAHIPHPFAPNWRLKVSFLGHQQSGILFANLLFP